MIRRSLLSGDLPSEPFRKMDLGIDGRELHLRHGMAREDVEVLVDVEFQHVSAGELVVGSSLRDGAGRGLLPSIRGQFGVDQDRFGVDLVSIQDRFGLDSGSIGCPNQVQRPKQVRRRTKFF